MKQINRSDNKSQRGSAGVKLLIAATILILIGNAFVNYVPTAYQGQSFEQEMETAVVQGVSMPGSHGKPIDVVRKRLKNTIQSNQLPYDTYLNVIEKSNVITARVYYVKKVQILPFGIYDYDYVFDHTATPNGFLK